MNQIVNSASERHDRRLKIEMRCDVFMRSTIIENRGNRVIKKKLKSGGLHNRLTEFCKFIRTDLVKSYGKTYKKK